MNIVFATYELDPINTGGAGVLISAVSRLLAKAGHRVTILCGFAATEVERANEFLRLQGFAPSQLRAECIDSLIGVARVAPHRSPFVEGTQRFARALAVLKRFVPIDVVEFPEYVGLGYETLRSRVLGDTKIIVRIHGSMQLIDEAMGRPTTPDEREMYSMERSALRMADVILAPSQGMLAHYQAHYTINAKRQLLAEPPMRALFKGLKQRTRKPKRCSFLYYGRLHEVKGADVFVDAAVRAIRQKPELPWSFTLVGSPSHCDRHNRNMRDCLESAIPADLRGFFHFRPAILREQLSDLTTSHAYGVFPSRFETFCLAAHELRYLGVPLVVPRIPAFVSHLNEETGCVTYDGSVAGLTSALLRCSEQPRSTPATAPLSYGDPIEAYGDFFDQHSSIDIRASGH